MRSVFAKNLGDLRLTPARVRWTPAEWQELADRIQRRRARHPDATLITLINQVQREDWPKDRRRKIGTIACCQELLPYLRQIDADLRQTIHDQQQQIESLQARLDHFSSQPTTDDVIASVSVETLCRRFAAADILQQLTLADIMQHVGSLITSQAKAIAELKDLGQHLRQELAEHLDSHAVKAIAGNGNGNGNGRHATPKLALVGFQQHMLAQFKNHFHKLVGKDVGLVFVPKAKLDFEHATHAIMHQASPPAQKLAAKEYFGHKLMVWKGETCGLLAGLDRILWAFFGAQTAKLNRRA